MKWLEFSLLTAVALASARPVAAEPAAAIAAASKPRDEGWGLELMIGAGGSVRDDAYERRLGDFSFESDDFNIGRYTLAAGRRLLDHMVVGATFFNMDAAAFTRDNQGIKQRYMWNSHAVGAFVQGDYSAQHHRQLIVFIRGGGGLAYGTTAFDEILAEAPFADAEPSFSSAGATTQRTHDHFTGFYVAGSVGVQMMPWDYGGFQFESRYVYAPALENGTGETHDLGGFTFLLGVRLRTWE